MDLPYPSRKDVAIDSQLKKIDKIYSKLMLSVKDIKQEECLSKWARDKIQKFIQSDNIAKLEKYLQKQAISYNRQVGSKSTKWNVVHYCAKHNSINSLKFILCKIYQEDKKQYKKIVNQKTFQGYTPLMISVINHSKDAMSILLHYGGIDIYQIDCKKMTAYEMSLNYNNQQAIKFLIEYQKKYKKKVSINQNQLLKPLQIQSIMQQSCYQSFMDYLVNCFICFKFQEEDQKRTDYKSSRAQNLIIQEVTLNKYNKEESNPNFLMKNMISLNNSILKNIWGSNQEKIDKVCIGREDLMGQYDICWKKMSELNNQKRVLFESFQPFDICENNFVIFNNLIIFQCLSDHTWLLRKIIRQKNLSESGIIQHGKTWTNNNNNEATQYIISIYQNNILKKITVDENIPFLKERQEPMFLSNSNELWPMILQKALAKFYGGYMTLAQIRPLRMLQDLTGFLTKKFQFSQNTNSIKIGDKVYNQKSVISVLQDFTTKGYMILLQGRQGTSLSPKEKTNVPYCYTILNYYQKGDKKLILINCPYVLQQWKQKQKTQIMQLKLIKSHYNKHNQMCVWIQQHQFFYFFKSMIISFIEPNYSRTQLKFKVRPDLSQIQTKVSSLDMNSYVVPSSQFNQTNQYQVKTERSLIKEKKTNSSIVQQRHSNEKPLRKTQTIFVKFRIQRQKAQPMILMLKNIQKCIQCKIIGYEGWVNQGNQLAQHCIDNNKNSLQAFTPELMRLVSKKGQYLLKVQFQYGLNVSARNNKRQSQFNKQNSLTLVNSVKEGLGLKKIHSSEPLERDLQKFDSQKKLHKFSQFMMICWCEQMVQLQFIEGEFAKLEWIESWKRFTIKNWSQQSTIQSLTLLNKSIILTKSSKQTNSYLKLKKTYWQEINEGNILQGRLIQVNLQGQDEVWIKMVRQQGNQNYSYAVLSNINNSGLGLRKQSIFQIFREDQIQKQKLKILLGQ